MPRKTKAEYEDLIAKTRGKLPTSLPSVENDRPSPSERLCRLAEIQCHIMLETRQSTFDTLTVLRQMSKMLDEMKEGIPVAHGEVDDFQRGNDAKNNTKALERIDRIKELKDDSASI